MAGSSLDAARASASFAVLRGVMGGDWKRSGFCGDRWWSLWRIKVRPFHSHRLRQRHVHEQASRVRPTWAIASSNAAVAEGLLRTQLQRVSEHLVYVGGEITYKYQALLWVLNLGFRGVFWNSFRLGYLSIIPTCDGYQWQMLCNTQVKILKSLNIG